MKFYIDDYWSCDEKPIEEAFLENDNWTVEISSLEELIGIIEKYGSCESQIIMPIWENDLYTISIANVKKAKENGN